MSYFNLKFRVDFLGHVKNVIINILFFTVYTCYYQETDHKLMSLIRQCFLNTLQKNPAIKMRNFFQTCE